MRGMVNENLTQRKGDFAEEGENCLAISAYLIENKIFLDENGEIIFLSDSDKNTNKGRWGEGRKLEYGTQEQISRWLNKYSSKDEPILSRPRISEVLALKSLPSDIFESIEMTHKGSIERRGDSLSKTQANHTNQWIRHGLMPLKSSISTQGMITPSMTSKGWKKTG